MRDISVLQKILSHPVYAGEERDAWLKAGSSLDDASFALLIDTLQKKNELADQILAMSAPATDEPRDPAQPSITIDDLTAFTPPQFFTEGMPNECGLLLDQLILFADMDGMKRMAAMLQELLKDQQVQKPEFRAQREQYESILLRLEWHRLFLLDDEAVDALLRTSLLRSLRAHMLVRDAIDWRFRFYLDLMQFGKERKKIVQSIRENRELIGSTPLQVAGEEANTQPPTAKQWLNEYERSFERGKVRSKVDRVTFVNTNMNTRRLNTQERTLLLDLLDLYDGIVFPPEVYEEVTHATPVAREIPKTAATITMKSFFEETSKEQQERDAVHASMDEQNNRAQRTMGDVIRLFLKTPPGTDAERMQFLVALRGEAKGGGLVHILVGPETHAQKFSMILRHILTNVILFDDAHAARFAAHIGMWLKSAGVPGYQQMVYFDAQKKQFFWKE
ncbi:hypothetical protein HY624_01290 [Candidatus Uhrbacteria bacterium]|nr:hypothetical protein [Candidatus Uhrbacteria bacterium]